MILHRLELMLRAGDPVNVGERCHLIVELADVPARNMEVSYGSPAKQATRYL